MVSLQAVRVSSKATPGSSLIIELSQTRIAVVCGKVLNIQEQEILNKDSLNGTWTIVPGVLEDNFFSGERRGDQLVYISTLNNQEIVVLAVEVLKKKELDLGVVIDELPMMVIDDSKPDLLERQGKDGSCILKQKIMPKRSMT